MKPLDIVTPVNKPHIVGIISEVSITQDIKKASITWFGRGHGVKSAWWSTNEITIIDSLPNVLARQMAHPFGDGKNNVDLFFALNK